MTRLLVIALLLASATPAAAQRRRPGRAPAEQVDRFDWKNATGATPSAAYRAAMKAGDREAARLFTPGIDLHASSHVALAEMVIRNYQRAIKADPTRAEPHYRLATVIHSRFLGDRNLEWVLAGDDKSRAELVLFHWSEFERLAPTDPRIFDYLFERAILHTKLPSRESYEKAIADYDRSIRYLKAAMPGLVTTRDIAINISNMAEVCMMAGDVERALSLYRESLEIDPEYSTAFGFAVTLDRDGQAWKARELIRKYATDGTLNNYVDRLTGRNPSEPRRIFYVPPGEVHYYFALIHDALGNDAIAISEYRQFIASRDHPQFHARARANIDDLMKRLKAGSRRPTRDLSWWRAWTSR